MLCQTCKKKEALVHISTGSTARERNRKGKHFCRGCADAYYVRSGMNSSRDLIRLSEFYRSKLYDELEAKHPEAFDNSDNEACLRGTEIMCRFLKQRLTKDNMKLNNDAFEMLCHDFFGSRYFYERVEKLKSKRSTDDA